MKILKKYLFLIPVTLLVSCAALYTGLHINLPS